MSLKILILSIVLSFTGSNCFSQQITKLDVEAMLIQVGSSMDKIIELYVTNTVVHYTDGTTAKSDATYESSNNNKFDLQENGIRVVYNPADKSGSVLFFPFSAMKYIQVNSTSISIHLAD